MSCLPNLKEASMNVFELPFNRFIGLEPSTDSEYLLMVRDRQEYLNHLNTVHASTQFALAEATSGFFLQNEFQGLTGYFRWCDGWRPSTKGQFKGSFTPRPSF